MDLNCLKRTSLFGVVVLFLIWPPLAHAENSGNSKLVQALIQVESSGDDSKIGDQDLPEPAYGPLQVRQWCVEDVNRIFHTSYRAEQCLNNRTLSIWIFEHYMLIWATKERLHHAPTNQDRARIWNGGPRGHRHSTTKSYWVKKVAPELARKAK